MGLGLIMLLLLCGARAIRRQNLDTEPCGSPHRQAGGQRHVSELLPGDARAAHRPLPAAPADHQEAHGDGAPRVQTPGGGRAHRHRPQLPHQRVQALPGSG